MKNRDLIARIRSGEATDAERREYARRVGRLAWPPECLHGHVECALVERGPCLDETLAGCSDGGADA